jgi:glutamate-1-semialdehyde 2,1-aminomutase
VIEGGYHGGVFFFAGENPLNVPMPFLRLRYNDCDGARAALRAAADDLAAVIVEPMLGGGGCIPASREFLATLAEEARASGALLVFDEVMTSRLAPGGLHGLHRLRPDLVTLGKYVGGGMSFGAFGGRADLMAHFDPFRPGAWPHAGTFNNNVLTMSAGLAGLTRIYTPEAMARLNAQGEALRADLGARMARADIPVVLTGIGSMMAWHVARTPPACPQDLADLPAELRALLHLDLIARGFYVARRGMIVLSLPMTAADTAAFAEAFEEVMRLRRGLILAALG